MLIAFWECEHFNNFKSNPILKFILKMNSTISKKEIILGLHQDGKSLDEIQATLMIMFENDLITSTEVIFVLLFI